MKTANTILILTNIPDSIALCDLKTHYFRVYGDKGLRVGIKMDPNSGKNLGTGFITGRLSTINKIIAKDAHYINGSKLKITIVGTKISKNLPKTPILTVTPKEVNETNGHGDAPMGDYLPAALHNDCIN